MRITVLLSALVSIIVLIISVAHIHAANAQTPLPPNTALGVATTTPTYFPEAAPQSAVQLDIPAIGLNAQVVPVGLDSTGAMDVPSGGSGNVGWYSAGTVPGAQGSAVIDAHVFAAFKNLHKLAVGSDLYIDTTGGGRLHFVVSDIETYKLADVPADTLFNKTGGRYLNLITCAGTYIPSQDTYDHRLVVYATLMSD